MAYEFKTKSTLKATSEKQENFSKPGPRRRRLICVEKYPSSSGFFTKEEKFCCPVTQSQSSCLPMPFFPADLGKRRDLNFTSPSVSDRNKIGARNCRELVLGQSGLMRSQLPAGQQQQRCPCTKSNYPCWKRERTTRTKKRNHWSKKFQGRAHLQSGCTQRRGGK